MFENIDEAIDNYVSLLDSSGQPVDKIQEFDSLDTVDELLPDGKNIRAILPALLQLQQDKEAVYGSSWRKYEHTSAFFNLARKWDRVDNIMQRALEDGIKTLFSSDSSTPTETFLDTVVDLANYGLLWASYIAKTQPELWDKFLETNKLK